MGQLPNKNNAIVDISKLEDYCLNTKHPRGKHKAKVFKRVIGFTKSEAELLKNKLLEAAKNYDATEISTDNYGTRYYIDSKISHKNKTAEIRSIWIIKSQEEFPRLITCYVK